MRETDSSRTASQCARINIKQYTKKKVWEGESLWCHPPVNCFSLSGEVKESFKLITTGFYPFLFLISSCK
jgi:hypothetical protein